MTLTRQMRQKRAFMIGTLYDGKGDITRDRMPKWEARLMFRGMEWEDADTMEFVWVPDDHDEPNMDWHTVNGS